MSQVRRLYVEKKPGFDGEAQALCRDLRHQLGLKGLTGVRILVRYDVAGMEDDDYAKACVSIFSEPMVDQIFHEELPCLLYTSVRPPEKSWRCCVQRGRGRCTCGFPPPR